jgi:hypothetical protein
MNMEEHCNEYPQNLKGYEIMRNIGKGAFGDVIKFNPRYGKPE